MVLSSIVSGQISESRNPAYKLQFDRIVLSDYISTEYFTCIGQDTYGFMWFGTKNGLCRYDGKVVKVYKSSPDDSTSISDNEIQSIFSDSHGNLWIGANGLHKYNFEKDNFIRIEPPAYDSLSLKLKFVNTICEDNKGNLWIGTFGQGLYNFNPISGSINHIKLGTNIPPPFKDFLVYSISFDGTETMWITSNGHQITSLNINTGKMNKFYLEQKGDIQYCFIDKNQKLWLLIMGDPLKQIIIGAGNKISFKSYDDIRTKDFFVCPQDDGFGNLWLGTQSEGVVIFNSSLGLIKNYSLNTRDFKSLSGNQVEDIFEDKAGNIWIATNKGVCKWSRWKKPFRHIQYDTENPNSIGSSEVTGIDEDNDGNLWISTLNTGFSKLNLKTEKVTRYDPSNSGINSPWALEILSANDGTVWIATNFQHGLNRFYPETGKFKEYRNNPENETSISSNLVTYLFEDRQSRIWIGAANSGLNLYNPQLNNFKRFVNNPSDKNTISSNEVFSIFQEDNSILWIGTDNGLNRFDLVIEKFESFSPPEFSAANQESFEVFSICEDLEKNIWLGTNFGLYHFNPDDKSFKLMLLLTGLPDTRIFGVLKDDSGNLWLQTISAIIKFNTKNKTYRIYDHHDGWIQKGVYEREWRNSYKKLKSGELVFGGANGITIFNPDEIKDNPEIPPVYITGFSLFNEPVEVSENPFGTREDNDSILTKSISLTKEIVLNHDENSFTFNFTSLDFTNPSANKCMYKLEGFDKGWIQANNVYSASFTNIPPGEYIFWVKATNSDGIWNEDGTSLKLTILPPWWKTTIAYIGYGLIFILLFYFIRKFELNRIKTRNQLRMKEFEANKLQEVDRMKSNFFANISHEFRTPLTLILGILDKYLKKPEQDNNDFKIMKKNADRSLQLINQLLELSRLESGTIKIKVQKVDFVKFIRRIASSFASLAEQKKISLMLNNRDLKSDELFDEVFVYIDFDKMETVIYNLLSNALKFTPENEKILIEISSTSSTIYVSVTNTGTNIPENELPYIFDRFYQSNKTSIKNIEGTGIGLALVKEIVELHRGEVKASSKDNQVTFKITLLAGSSHFSSDQILTEEKEITSEIPVLISDTEEIITDHKELEKDKKVSGILLVVEDHFDLRNFICEQLEDDYSIIEAEDGEKGLALAEELIPDLVISDIMMPKMDGYRLCKEIKTNIKTNHIPVILLTAKAALESKLEGLETGADDYLIKPFNTDELKARVRNLILIRQQMREKFRSEMVLRPAEVIVPSNQKVFIENLTRIIEAYIDDERFSVEQLSKEMGMSRSQLHRKVKALTNQSPNEFIRSYRLQRAAELIRKQAGNFAEIAYKVGFSSQAYFTKLFQDMFGKTPSEYKKQNSGTEN